MRVNGTDLLAFLNRKMNNVDNHGQSNGDSGSESNGSDGRKYHPSFYNPDECGEHPEGTCCGHDDCHGDVDVTYTINQAQIMDKHDASLDLAESGDDIWMNYPDVVVTGTAGLGLRAMPDGDTVQIGLIGPVILMEGNATGTGTEGFVTAGAILGIAMSFDVLKELAVGIMQVLPDGLGGSSEFLYNTVLEYHEQNGTTPPSRDVIDHICDVTRDQFIAELTGKMAEGIEGGDES